MRCAFVLAKPFDRLKAALHQVVVFQPKRRDEDQEGDPAGGAEEPPVAENQHILQRNAVELPTEEGDGHGNN